MVIIGLRVNRDLELKSGCIGVQGLKHALRRRGMLCFIGKGWTGGLKISSHITFDQQPSVGRAFS
jgi:hypothetical protein